MSSETPRPRKTPLTVKLAYAQLALTAVAFAAVPIYALKRHAQGPAPLAAAPVVAEEEADAAPAAALSTDPAARGEAIFAQSCAGCHQATGEGIPGVFPPLAKSDYLLADTDRAIGVVLHGLVGPVTVNGVNYESAMPPMPLDDADVAAVLSYVLQAWGNAGPTVSVEEVARVRAASTPGT